MRLLRVETSIVGMAIVTKFYFLGICYRTVVE